LQGCDTMHHIDKLARFPTVDAEPSFRMRIERDVPFSCPKDKPLSETAVSRTFAERDGRYTVYRGDHKTSMTYDASYTDVCLRLSPQTPYEAVREYLAVLQCFSYHLLCTGGSLLHSAGVAVGEVGVALVGRPQVGKSTMAGRILRCEPTAEILCEDAPAVIKRDGRFWLCGTPFCGDDDACSARTVPLRGLVILEQGTENRVTEVSSREAMFHLMEAIPRPLYDGGASEKAVALAMEWIDALPILKFENDGSDAAGELLLRTLRSKGWFTERTTHL